jgi:hypothetical protein
MKRQQHTLMKYDPATGEERPYPSNAADWREWHGLSAWLFNPWTGEKRDVRDIGSDVHGLLIIPPGESVYAESKPRLSREKLFKAAEDADFVRIKTCCEGVSLKVCSTDEWRGDLGGLAAKIIEASHDH